ncbi:MAG: sulfotransferase [Actinomycetota bacterium]
MSRGSATRARAGLRSVRRLLSPDHRRWRRFSETLTLDPERLPRPLEAPGPNDFLICGSPRTGTSLLCAALFQPPRCITVMEPWDGMRLAPARLFPSLREEMEETGHLRRGKLDVTTLYRDGGVRWCTEGVSAVPVRCPDDCLVGIKWPAFWRYLELLPATKFVVCLRHPLEVVASYRKAGGSLAEGFDYDIPFNRAMNAELRASTADEAIRRIRLYDYINARVLPFLERPNVLAVRYERWFTEPEAVLNELGEFLGTDLRGNRARIQPPRQEDQWREEIQLIRAHCTTAERLGYAL